MLTEEARDEAGNVLWCDEPYILKGLSLAGERMRRGGIDYVVVSSVQQGGRVLTVVRRDTPRLGSTLVDARNGCLRL